MSLNDYHAHRPSRARFSSRLVIAILISGLYFGFNLWLVRSRPWLSLASARIDDDIGIVLEVLDRLHAGKRLYSEVFWQYGPVAILPFLLGGGQQPIGPQQYCYINITIVSLGLGILAWGLDRVTQRRIAIAAMLLLFLPSWGALGPAYFAPQFLFLVLLAAAWEPAKSRSRLRTLVCGGLLACLHLNKFGTHVQAGLAVLILDTLHARSAGSALSVRTVVRDEVPLAVAYGVTLALAAAVLYIIGFRQTQLVDAFLPLHMLSIYGALPLDRSIIRHAIHSTPRYFVGVLLPWFAGLFALVVTARHTKDDDIRRSGLSILPWTFVIGTFTVYRLVFHYLMHAHYLLFAIPLGIQGMTRRARAALLLACMPWVFLSVRSVFAVVGATDFVPVTTPRGYSLWTPLSQTASLRELFDTLGSRIRGKPGTLLSGSHEHHSAGFYFFLDSVPATRHMFLVPQSSVPERERDQFVQQILSGEWILVPLPRQGTYRDGIQMSNILDPARLQFLAQSTRQCATTLNEPRMALLVPLSRPCP